MYIGNTMDIENTTVKVLLMILRENNGRLLKSVTF